MGNLAERYKDADRSGVYGVRDAGVPRAAAIEAGAFLIEVGASRLREEWWRVEQAIGAETARACVLLVAGASALALPEHFGMLERLRAATAAGREASRPIFAVMVDPDGRLELPLLYREKPG
ncbi:MAG: hypothetical protein ABI669_08065 [Usitatibacter sp.]